MVKFGYTIVYVPSVSDALSFFKSAFGLTTKFLHESQQYGELDTGSTTLAFAHHHLGESHFPHGYVKANESKHPLGMEIALVTTHVHATHARAIGCGATEITAPTHQPWGQIVSYLRSPEGILIELCSPVETHSE